MYVDRKHRRWPFVAALAAAVLLVGILVGQAMRRSGQEMETEAAAALKAAVDRSALQCYVVEGAYPSSLEYLEENYGLQINLEDFYVTYDAFASNLPPDTRVVGKH